MKKKSTSRSAFLSPRALVGLLCMAAACSILTLPLLAVLRSEGSAKVSHPVVAGLTFEERVAYQRAIEAVYWRHRTWPKERSDPKPSLDAVMSRTQLEKEVADYLRKSQALEDYWQRPLTAEQLQAEMDRMAKNTKQPDVLGELFEALGNDPFVIAECLARPTLVDRKMPTAALEKESIDLSSNRAGTQFIKPMPEASVKYTLPTISTGAGCVGDTWAATSIQPEGRSHHTAVWTDSEMIVWGGVGQASELNTGGTYNPNSASGPTPTPIPLLNTGARYNPDTDGWTATSTFNAPEPRDYHTAIWTGSEMIIWGGFAINSYSNSGGRYNPTFDTWSGTSFGSAPSPRWGHTAVWTGTEMIIWGGFGASGDLNSGGRYNPNTDSWTATSTVNAPDGRDRHTAVWTGSEMIVWGGTIDNGITVLNTGGRYNPSTNSWTATTLTNTPSARFLHTAVWSGSEMVTWAGVDDNLFDLNTGGRYRPITDSWTATKIITAPTERAGHTAIWTGNEMIVWGGYPRVVTGGRYNPGADTWTATSNANAPPGRDYHTAIWTGSEMIVWGGQDDFGNNLNTGGRYCVQFASPTPSPTPTATPRATPTPRSRPTPPPRPTPR